MIKQATTAKVAKYAFVYGCASVTLGAAALIGAALMGCEAPVTKGEAEAMSASSPFGYLSAIAKDQSAAYLYARPSNRVRVRSGALRLDVTGPVDHVAHSFELRPRKLHGVEHGATVLAANIAKSDVAWWSTNFPHGFTAGTPITVHVNNRFDIPKGVGATDLEWNVAVRDGHVVQTGPIQNQAGKRMLTRLQFDSNRDGRVNSRDRTAVSIAMR